jgi:hypothetical protein
MSTVTTQREHPILFSAEMVRAILEDRKTMTRRIVKLRDPSQTYSTFDDDGWPLYADEYGVWNRDSCPYGKVGDLLWVRETAWYDDAFGGRAFFENGDVLIKGEGIVSKAPHPCSREMFQACGLQKIRPSIHMPRWASRLLLRIKDVRVERLQQISEEDAAAEGVDFIPSAPAAFTHRTAFKGLWDKINVKRGYGWESDPSVWVIEFERVQQNQGN